MNTPRTDCEIFRAFVHDSVRSVEIEVVNASFGRLLERELARLMAENERYKIALTELVALKEIKDRITDLVRKRFEMNTLEYAGLQLMKADYDTRKPIAWAEARATLKGEPK